MADDKFKTAAAKLLAQHAAKQENKPLPKPSDPMEDTVPVPAQPSRNLDLIWQNKINETPSFIPEPTVAVVNPYVRSSSFSFYKISMVLLHAAIGCGLMFELVPPIIIFGITGNIAIGMVAGSIFGLIIANIL